MAEGTPVVSSENNSSDHHPDSEGAGGEGGESQGASGLSAAQQEVLERCLHALTHAKNDSHTLAALLLVRLSTLLVSELTILLSQNMLWC